MLDNDALKVFGVQSYAKVWGANGQAVRRAEQLLAAPASERPAAAARVGEAAKELVDAERFRQRDRDKYAAARGECDGTCVPAGSCDPCQSRSSHNHMLREIAACRAALESLASGSASAEAAAEAADPTALAHAGRGGAGGGAEAVRPLSKGAKKNRKKKAKKAKNAAAGRGGASDSGDSD